ncbi:Gldg family protein [Pedobacter sp. MC2016-24]|uniref:Gldg family protein n=1 Tax=Pedobacter sp. MC2016-24 TaxID=2780090 RepID=UPI0018817E13|nr:Gldg family protein [Pedobacter sp. MC2016-24]MBE9602433.1 Gldg family protein [Pedobacter sp. MC2016-24]
MKTIFKIAKTELQVLFYSPVAWLILIIFSFQLGAIFTGGFDFLVKINITMKQPLSNVTFNSFGSAFNGLFVKMQGYLYLYIPLLTMSIMSRELGSGSIKLLYSSPISNRQIILGKYVALMAFGLVMIGIVSIFCLFTIITVDHPDIPYLLTGLVGLYLLICAYAAIGLFMSSLTTYNVVAALGTLCIFGLLAYVKGVGQDMELVRDVTYWLAITGRSDTFIAGMITSEDVLYFLIVIALFLAFTIIKLHSGRQKNKWITVLGRYLTVFLVAIVLGYFSAQPSFKAYYDATRAKVNTLTKSSQEVMSKLDGGFTITTYSNMLDPTGYTALPIGYKNDVSSFNQYIRFKPEIKLNYKYYYEPTENPMLDRMYPKLDAKQRLDTLIKLNNWNFDIVPYGDLKNEVSLKEENFRFVRVLERENGQKTFLRIFDDMRRLPSEAEITAAIKRLVMKLPVVGFVHGHGERDSNGETDRGYKTIARLKTFRYSLINQGFDFKDLTLDQPIPQDIKIIVIAEPKNGYRAEEQANLDQYIARGGNLIIAGEPGREQQMNAITANLGVKFLPGRLVKPAVKFQSDLMLMRPTQAAIDFSPHFKLMNKMEEVLSMPSANALEYQEDKGFKVTPLFRTDSVGSWNEIETTNFVDDSVKLNPAAAEVEKSYPTVLALSRKIRDKEQKIIITGDADWMSNGELGMQRNDVRASNYSLIVASFFWLSNGEVPIDMRRDDPIDNALHLTVGAWAFFGLFLKWGIPLGMLAASLIIWIRRRGR